MSDIYIFLKSQWIFLIWVEYNMTLMETLDLQSKGHGFDSGCANGSRGYLVEQTSLIWPWWVGASCLLHQISSVNMKSVSGQAVKVLDPRSRGQGFNSCNWSCAISLGQPLNPHCLWTSSSDGYLVYRFKVGLMVATANRFGGVVGEEIN